MTAKLVDPDQLVAHGCPVAPERITIAVALEDSSAVLAFTNEPFDSELLGWSIGRVAWTNATTVAAHAGLLCALHCEATEQGFDQVLRRVEVADRQAIWALESAGFHLMDVGVTFARHRSAEGESSNIDSGLAVRLADERDVEMLVDGMAGQPWGSRYDADPTYTAERIEALRARWLWNSFKGRAAAFLVGEIDGQVAGYVVCLFDEQTGHGEIDLVGTIPKFRGRGVAAAAIQAAVRWFDSVADLVTVRTQASNFTAAALYERAGFRLSSSDITYRKRFDSEEQVA
jgi:RimJ/RimL family protein N-acetyltransferase